jgi:hypothetical protein
MNQRIENAVRRLNRESCGKGIGCFPQKPLSAGRIFSKKREGVLTGVPARDTMQAEVRK